MSAETPTIATDRQADGTLAVRFEGSWTVRAGIPAVAPLEAELRATPPTGLRLDASGVGEWDSGFLVFLDRLLRPCREARIPIDQEALPGGARRLLELAAAVPEKKDARREDDTAPFLARVGTRTMGITRSIGQFMEFLGEAILSLGRLCTGQARFRRSDLWMIIQDCGARALPIVSLISFLVGVILALVGAVQLQLFAAEIFVANLVGLAMAREMAPIMTGIIMSGRTGAAFAAQLGTMTVNEEIDALRTMGISGMDFLVLPRMLALILMMPLLCLYANLLGILGGAVVGVGMLGITVPQYINQTIGAVTPTDFTIGLVKCSIFGALVALAGCLKGIQCGRSAQAVGGAATSAVVMGIVLIIVVDTVATVVCNVLGI